MSIISCVFVYFHIVIEGSMLVMKYLACHALPSADPTLQTTDRGTARLAATVAAAAAG